MKQFYKIRHLFILLLIFSFGFCADLPVPPKPNLPNQNLLVTISSDFSTGFLSALNLKNEKVYKDILPVHSDSVVVSNHNSIYVLNRLGIDSIMRIEPDSDFTLSYETSMGKRSNPYDIAFISSQKAVVALYGRSYLSVIDPRNGKELSQIDLSFYADQDGIPEISAVYYYQNKLYALLQRLDRNQVSTYIWPPVDKSYLIKMNDTNFAIEKAHVLPFTNPSSRIRFFSDRNTFVFTASGYFGANYALDGGIVEFNPATGTFLNSPLTEAQAGLEITDAILQSSHLGFAICQDKNFNSFLIAFNPSTGSTIKTLASHSYSIGGYFSGLEMHNGKLYVADRNAQNPGIRLFDTHTLNEITQNPRYIGLPPTRLFLHRPQ